MIVVCEYQIWAEEIAVFFGHAGRKGDGAEKEKTTSSTFISSFK
jgi:hypothetical protein